MYSCLLIGVISDYLLIRNSSKKWPIYSGYSLLSPSLLRHKDLYWTSAWYETLHRNKLECGRRKDAYPLWRLDYSRWRMWVAIDCMHTSPSFFFNHSHMCFAKPTSIFLKWILELKYLAIYILLFCSAERKTRFAQVFKFQKKYIFFGTFLFSLYL